MNWLGLLTGWQGKAIVLLLSGSLSALAAWYVTGAVKDRDMHKLRTQFAEYRTQAETEANRMAAANAAREAKLQLAANQIELQYQKEAANAQRLTNDLRRAVNTGNLRLRLNATCSGIVLPNADGTGSATGGDAAACELTGVARENYFALRSGIDETLATLNACQAYARAVSAPHQ